MLHIQVIATHTLELHARISGVQGGGHGGAGKVRESVEMIKQGTISIVSASLLYPRAPTHRATCVSVKLGAGDNKRNSQLSAPPRGSLPLRCSLGRATEGLAACTGSRDPGWCLNQVCAIPNFEDPFAVIAHLNLP